MARKKTPPEYGESDYMPLVSTLYHGTLGNAIC
jgi:hypothetical protein